MKAVLDLETGGFSITKNGVCEIAMIAIDDKFNVIDTFHEFIQPYYREEPADELVSYKDDAMSVNGLTVDFLVENGKPIEIVSKELLYFIDSNNIDTIIGHNINFDIMRAKYLINRFVGKDIGEIKTVDTLNLCRKTGNFLKNDLTYVCNAIGIKNEKAHSALSDCYAALEVYKYFNK